MSPELYGWQDPAETSGSLEAEYESLEHDLGRVQALLSLVLAPLIWQRIAEERRVGEDLSVGEELAGRVVGPIARQLMPLELVAPPLPLDRLGVLDEAVDELRRAGAVGTWDQPVYGFSVHINPEPWAVDAAALTAVIRAYAILQRFLIELLHVDPWGMISPMPSVAETIATNLGAHAQLLETDGDTTSIIALPDGRVPLLVRDYGHVVLVRLADTRSWSASRIDADALREIIEATTSWAAGCSSETATLFELASSIATKLTDALAQRWTISFPGVPEPREAWLHGPEFDAAAVGVFAGRAVVWVGSQAHEFMLRSRRELTARSPKIVAAVRSQLAAYARNLEISPRVQASADDLAAKLGERLGTPCRVELRSRPSHWQAVEARLLGESGELARVFAQADEVRVHAGLDGDDGWQGSDIEAGFEAIVTAIVRAAATLTIERLTPGHRYRVIRDIGELRTGVVVQFVKINDIDNHYGIGEFRGPNGETLEVPGDYSTPRSSPLGPAYRYLERTLGEGGSIF